MLLTGNSAQILHGKYDFELTFLNHHLALLHSLYFFFISKTRFLAFAEDIVVPYRFGVYDLLVLPPSFPYGGMENACLTFLTPSMSIAFHLVRNYLNFFTTSSTSRRSHFGRCHCSRAHPFLVRERRNASLLSQKFNYTHRLICYASLFHRHAYASHFWLNEGWTTYIERLLLEVIHTPADRGFSFIIGYKALQDALKLYVDTPKYQRLVIEFEKGEDPDDAYST